MGNLGTRWPDPGLLSLLLVSQFSRAHIKMPNLGSVLLGHTKEMSLGITQGQIDSGLPLFPFVTPVGNNIWTRKIQQMS